MRMFWKDYLHKILALAINLAPQYGIIPIDLWLKELLLINYFVKLVARIPVSSH